MQTCLLSVSSAKFGYIYALLSILQVVAVFVVVGLWERMGGGVCFMVNKDWCDSGSVRCCPVPACSELPGEETLWSGAACVWEK